MALPDFRFFDDKLAGCGIFMLDEDVALLKSQSITAVVSLQDLTDTRDAVKKGGLRHLILPLESGTVPSDELVGQFLGFVRDEAKAGGKTVVHCAGGTWRTALMGAYWLIDNGLSVSEAIHIVRYVLPGYQTNALQNFALKKASSTIQPPEESLRQQARKTNH